MPRALLTDKLGLGKTCTSVAAAMICKTLIETVVVELLLSIVWGNSLEEWANTVQNNYPGNVW